MLAKSLRENQPFPALDVFVRVWRWAGAYMAQAPGGGNGKRKKWRQGPKGGRKWRGRTSCACSNVQDLLGAPPWLTAGSWGWHRHTSGSFPIGAKKSFSFRTRLKAMCLPAFNQLRRCSLAAVGSHIRFVALL